MTVTVTVEDMVVGFGAMYFVFVIVGVTTVVPIAVTKYVFVGFSVEVVVVV